MTKRFLRARSRILKLPQDIQREIDRMLLGVGPERKTYDEVVAWVKDRGYETSTSAISRYYRYLKTLENVKIASQQVKAILDETDKDSMLELEEGISRMASAIVMEILQEAETSRKTDIQYVTRIIGEFARLQMSSVAREKLKIEFRRKAQKAVENIEKTAQKQLDPETLRKIREEIYGIV